jgi:hypothetical protein
MRTAHTLPGTAPTVGTPSRRPGSKLVAIVQSNYIPWKGYFDLINLVDEFILLDDVQYTRRDWRNRNRIKTANGAQWLTIPVETKGRYFQTISETVVSDPDWPAHHWRTLQHHFAAAPYFKAYWPRLEELYGALHERYLSEINYRFITAICELLGIPTKITWSMEYESSGQKTERLIGLCKQAGATAYLSGPAARAYLDEALFDQEGVALHYMDYSGYPEYPQLYPPFDHAVTMLDLLFNVGPAAPKYLKSFGA